MTPEPSEQAAPPSVGRTRAVTAGSVRTDNRCRDIGRFPLVAAGRIFAWYLRLPMTDHRSEDRMTTLEERERTLLIKLDMIKRKLPAKLIPLEPK